MTATFSPCRTWRYVLRREIASSRLACTASVLFVCLNPSTADETADDPTVRRCVGYARSWGFGKLVVCNLFGLRSTDPKALYAHADPVGPGNDDWLRWEAREAAMIVAAWGARGRLLGRGQRVEDLLQLEERRELHLLGRIKSGEPRHPLYLRADLDPMWAGRAL